MDPEKFQTVLRKVIIPAMAGAAGTGALTAYVSSKNKPRNELPADRRKRIMRQGLIGAGLGAAAGGALPLGMQMLARPFGGGNGGSGVSGIANAAGGAAVGHAAGLGTLAGGGLWMAKRRAGHQEKATGTLMDLLRGSGVKGLDFKNTGQLQGTLNSKGGIGTVLGGAARGYSQKRQPNLRNVFITNELLRESGQHKGMSLKEMIAQFGGQPGGERLPAGVPRINIAPEKVMGEFKDHLANQGPLAKVMSKFVRPNVPAFQDLRRFDLVDALTARSGLADKAVTGLERFNPTPIAEGYSRYVRPAAGRMIGRSNPLLALGAIGGGALLADKAQQRLMGTN